MSDPTERLRGIIANIDNFGCPNCHATGRADPLGHLNRYYKEGDDGLRTLIAIECRVCRITWDLN